MFRSFILSAPLAALTAISVWAQAPADSSVSTRIATRCRPLATTARQLYDMATTETSPPEQRLIMALSGVAGAAGDRCIAVYELLHAVELVPPGADKDSVAAFVSTEFKNYRRRFDAEITSASRLGEATRVAAMARQAAALADEMRRLLSIVSFDGK